MKKLISLSLVLVLVLSLAACGGKNNAGPENTGENIAGNAVADNQNEPVQQPENDPPVEENTPVDPGENTEEPEGETEQPGEQPNDEAKEEPAVITISHTDVTFKAAGNSFKLRPKGVSGDYTVTYTSTDVTVATVAEDGTVTAVAPGTTTVNMQVKQGDILYDANCIIRCNWKETSAEEDETDKTAQSVELAAFFTGFMEGLGENAPFMVALEGEILDAFYPGLSAFALKQSVLQMAGMSAVPYEFALVELENAGDAEAIRAILQSRVDAQVSGGAWYDETIAAWEKAEIIVTGNFVAMIVAGDQQAEAVAAYKALFNG